jgi:RND family efflux transporter MFP subunit
MKYLPFLLFLAACGGGQPQGGFPGGPGGPGARATSVEVREVATAPISDQIRAYGTVRAQDNIQVTAQVSERIVRLLADLGDRVQAGQSLAKLNDTAFLEQLSRDAAQMEQARIAMERDSVSLVRATDLFERGLSSQAEFDNVRTTAAASRAQYRSAVAAWTASSQNMRYTEVRAPVSGAIVKRNLGVGDIAGGGQPIFELSNTGGFEVRLYLTLEDWRNARVGQDVELRLSNDAETMVPAVVTRLSPQLDATTGLGEVVIRLTGRSDRILAGSLVEARINVATKPDVVVIPRSAMVETVQTVIEPESNVIRLRRTYAAFVTQGDSVAVRRELDLGIQQGDRIEVVSGLAPGERLVITGQSGLEDGARIRVSGLPRFEPGERPIRN